MPLNKKKNRIARPAPAGSVITQDMKILPMTLRFRAAMPRAKPTPSTAPTRVWVVEIGSPVADAVTTVAAAPNSAAKPRLGVSSVILRPTVVITFQP